ncbi:MAG: PfkB family carbohydrate kinase [Phycisphaerae bacterium]|nr:PfkB family carbohydrate kinase [Phycisphaerae bacterium]
MSLLVTGSIGIDTVETPFGKVENVLGGSAVYFSLAASNFSPVRLVGVVGEDFPPVFRDVFGERPIDLAGLELRRGSKTFRWQGRYVGDMNEAQTLRTDLNVLAEAAPKIPLAFRDSDVVFLANTHPLLQRELLASVSKPKLVVCDTMNLWIDTARTELARTLAMVHGVVLNDHEGRMLTSANNLVEVARRVLGMGPRFVVIKKGEHGSMLATGDEFFALPAFPTTKVVDPTGAGDSFAGGMLGYLASVGRFEPADLLAALARGTVTASFTIEGFSVEAIRRVTKAAIDQRLTALRRMVQFE